MKKINYPIIVHSHLPWKGVWQRPQQFHSRLSKRHPILFVEGPVPKAERTDSMLRSIPLSDYPGVTLIEMEVPGSRWHDGAFIDSERRRLLDNFLESNEGLKYANAVQWFYDPMAYPSYAEGMNELAVVYDCMDQLSQFKFAPPQIIEREKQLISGADLIFAGGPKLHKSKSVLHDNCHCFGCGVDITHFSKALDERTEIPDDVLQLKGPVLGFFGVVDERMDYELLQKLAQANPNWNVVVIGPTAKVDPAQFPKETNILWLGRREYPDLPRYCKAFDVCLLPFAINEATEYINPTKALEYMATGRPIVSTRIEDVVQQFSDIVKIAHHHEEFIQHCQKLVKVPDSSAIRKGIARAQKRSWEAIVDQMEHLIEEALETEPVEAESVA